MKRPIEASEIRKGDLIRLEFDADEAATEYRAVKDREGMAQGVYGPTTYIAGASRRYLLDRPEPAVELPPEPTLGWLSGPEISPLLDMWHEEIVTDRGPTAGRYVAGEITGTFALDSEVTAFTPATAVPTDALDELRGFLVHSATGKSLDQIRDFLTCVRAANGNA